MSQSRLHKFMQKITIKNIYNSHVINIITMSKINLSTIYIWHYKHKRQRSYGKSVSNIRGKDGKSVSNIRGKDHGKSVSNIRSISKEKIMIRDSTNSV